MIEFGEKMSDEWTDGDERDIDKEMMRLTLNIVGKTLFSANVEDDATEIGEAMTTIVSMFNLLLLPVFGDSRKTSSAAFDKIQNARKKLSTK